jgi:hypothetical protein
VRTAGWGRRPLGSLPDQFSESGIEPLLGWWVDRPIGFSVGVSAVRIHFDGPLVLMKESVVLSAEKDQIL